MKHLLVFPLALVLVLATTAGADMEPKSGPGDLTWIMLVSISAVVILGGAVYALLTLDDDTDDPAAVGGRLSDDLTGEPLAGVRVLLYEDWTDAATPADRSGYFIAETTTDVEGAFSFTIEPGSYLIICNTEGYEKTDRLSVSVDDGETTTLLIRLTPLVETPLD